ncbi:Cysteine-rich secretory protein LCCL domain-containing 2 [Bulinus truncatus]|nr:Cysteine-rich secretory protein LCCL domain-containing 2 [Bulinus truncatus]
MELEAQARQWAEGCVFDHELKNGRGENLAWVSNQKTEKELISHGSELWFNETQFYNYGQHSCGRSCEYTQMVWDITSKLGCYSHRCPNLFNAYRNAWYLVCFYTPEGNWNGERPYEKECKTKCRKGQTEEKGLCVGESKDKVVKAGEKQDICVDNQGMCPQLAKKGKCESKKDYMMQHCKMSCNLCQQKRL